MKKNLTLAKIRRFEPRSQRYKVVDGGGLALEVRPNGTKVWRLRCTIHGRRTEISLGRYPRVSLAEARDAREQVLAAAGRKGSRYYAELRRVTVKAFAERYLKEQVSRVRKNPATIRRYFERDVYPAIGSESFVAVEKQQLRKLISAKIEAGHEQAALALRNILKRLWDYAIECELTEKNLPKLIEAKYIATVSSRSRALNEAELRAFLKALNCQRNRIRIEIKDAIRLILLTLVRKSELRLARWDEFDLDRAEWALPQEHSKMETPLVIPLSQQAVEILRRQRARNPKATIVFPMIGGLHEPMSASTLNRALSRIKLKIEHFTIHDLRRTAATTLAEQEYNSDWIEKALNHKLQGVRGVYNRAQYAKQRREMLQAWADWLDGLKG